MSEPAPETAERTYGCTLACGNPYDVIVVQVSDSTTMFLCMPCFVKVASDVMAALLDPNDETLNKARELMPYVFSDTAPGPKPKKRGKNAPTGADDDSLIEAFDGRISVDELPAEFR